MVLKRCRVLFSVSLLVSVLFMFFFVSVVFAGTTTSECRLLNKSTNLSQHINSSPTCLTINVSNMVLDCKGFKIVVDANDVTGNSYAINNSGGFDNVTIKNCVMSMNDTATLGEHAILMNWSDNSTLYNNTILGRLTGENNTHLINVSFSANFNFTANNASAAGTVLFFMNSTGAVIERNNLTQTQNNKPNIIHFLDSPLGIVFNNTFQSGVDRALPAGVYAEGNGSQGFNISFNRFNVSSVSVLLDEDVTDAALVKNVVRNGSRRAFVVSDGAERINISHNDVFNPAGLDAIQCIAVISHPIRTLRIVGNVVNTSGKEGIHLTHAINPFIVNNTINSTSDEAIYLLNTNGSTIMGNDLYGESSTVVYSQAPRFGNFIFAFNTVYQHAGVDIAVRVATAEDDLTAGTAGTAFNISHNNITFDTTSSGISVLRTDNTSIVANNITIRLGNSSKGITVSTTDYSRIMGNIITSSNATAIDDNIITGIDIRGSSGLNVSYNSINLSNPYARGITFQSVEDSNTNRVQYNTLYLLGNYSTGIGHGSATSQYNTSVIAFNTITVYNGSVGIELNGNFNNISDNNITSHNFNGSGILLNNSVVNNTFENNFINANGSEIAYTPGNVTGNNTLFYSTVQGSINWTQRNLSTNMTLHVGNTLVIEHNMVSVANSSQLKGLNSSARIALHLLHYVDAVRLFKNGVRCDNITDCNVSYDLSTEVLVANVSGFSAYTSTGKAPNPKKFKDGSFGGSRKRGVGVVKKIAVGKKPKHVLVQKQDKASVQVGKSQYKLTVVATAQQRDATFRLGQKIVSLKVGREAQVDVDNDQEPDVRVKLNRVLYNAIDVELSTVDGKTIVVQVPTASSPIKERDVVVQEVSAHPVKQQKITARVVQEENVISSKFTGNKQVVFVGMVTVLILTTVLFFTKNLSGFSKKKKRV